MAIRDVVAPAPEPEPASASTARRVMSAFCEGTRVSAIHERPVLRYSEVFGPGAEG